MTGVSRMMYRLDYAFTPSLSLANCPASTLPADIRKLLG
jgi:hypothetical protein